MTLSYEALDNTNKSIISKEMLLDTIDLISSSEGFQDQHSIVLAIKLIVGYIQDVTDRECLKSSDALFALIRENWPFPNEEIEITRKWLNRKSLIVQILALMTSLEYQQKIEMMWLAICLHTTIRLIYHNKKTAYKQLLTRFKLAIFYSTHNYQWIWKELPHIENRDVVTADELITALKRLLDALGAQIEDSDYDPYALRINEKEKAKLRRKVNQVRQIHRGFEQAYYPNLKSKKSNKENLIKPKKPRKSRPKPPNLSSENQQLVRPVQPNAYLWDTDSDDVEQLAQPLAYQYFDGIIESHPNLPSSFEEIVDQKDLPFLTYAGIPDRVIRHSPPLQVVDISVQQNYISQRDLGLNSNTRILSLAGYQVLFSRLSTDADKFHLQVSRDSIIAAVLLLSMISATPVDSLITPNFFNQSTLFLRGERFSYIQHTLGITKREEKFDETKHQNEKDIIKLPIPTWLIEILIKSKMPTKEEFNQYLKKLRYELNLPYLSLARVESALHIVLSRYTLGCDSHLADLICRTPPSHAPAMYYSSHLNSELASYYLSAIQVLNKAGSLGTYDIQMRRDSSVGSVFALTLEYVAHFIKQLKRWVLESRSYNEGFNRISTYIWFVFCLLTGVRPNNGIGNIRDIDLHIGWLVISDKGNKSVKNPRIIPLCTTLIQHLRSYQTLLSDYQQHHLAKDKININIHKIKCEEDISLLSFLANSHDNLVMIKRGEIYEMTRKLNDMSPYWTRHFVRTQLEKMGVNVTLINTIIGHERNRQEALGRYSSISKSQIKKVGEIFNHIAQQLDLTEIAWLENLHFIGGKDEK